LHEGVTEVIVEGAGFTVIRNDPDLVLVWTEVPVTVTAMAVVTDAGGV
jgi:hypothetical protein